jgi:hypothetical protein
MSRTPRALKLAKKLERAPRRSIAAILRGLWPKARVVDPPPILKPYSGVGATFWQRHLTLIVMLLLGVVCIPYGFYYALFTPWLIVNFLAPLGILLIIVIWALPQVKRTPDVAIERWFFAFFITFSLWPNYLALALPGLPWITVTRLTDTPLVIVFLAGLSTSPVMAGRMKAILKETPLLWKTLVFFAFLQLMSIGFSAHPFESVSKFLVHTTSETAIFFVCAYVFRLPGRLQRWAWMLWAFAVILSFITLFEFRQSQVLWAGHVPSLLAVQDPVVARILAGGMRFTTDTYRAQSIFSTSLGCSEYLAYATPFILHFAASPNYKPAVRIAAGLSAFLVINAILATDSRLGILGFFIATMLYLLVWAARKWQRQPHSLLAPTILAGYPVLFAACIIASLTVGRIKAHVWGMGQYENSNQARIDQFHMSIPKIISHPFGHGIGQGAESLGYVNLAGGLTIDVYYVLVLMEYGIIGFITFFSIFILSIGYAVRYVMFSPQEKREFTFAFPLSIALLIFIVVKAFFAQEDNHPVVFMLAGITAALVYRVRRAERASTDAAILSPLAFPGFRTGRPAPAT